MIRRLAVLTSGGDCSGMNATLRAVVRTAIARDLSVVGIRKGYTGLLNGWWEDLGSRSVSGILQRGGTVLQSARTPEMYQEAGQQRAAARLSDCGADALVVIGGEGSLKGALALHRLGIPVVAIPASIDNDIPGTDMSLGVDTALNNIIHAVDALRDTASSHDRAFVVETMGRNCGYLAVVSAIACGAEYTIIPEAPVDLEELCVNLRQRFEEGRSNSIIMVAEGAGSAQQIAERIKDSIGFETRIMVLGHYQRGGAPSVGDRLLGSRFGMGAVEGLLAGERGSMIGVSCSNLVFTPLENVAEGGRRPIDRLLLRLAVTLGR